MIEYDLLLKGARVVDPQNEVDAPLDLGVAAGKVRAVGTELPAAAARQVIDLTGYTVVPGLIDTHVHVRGPAHRMMALAGVCTALDMATMREAIAEFPERGCGLNIAGLQVVGPWPDRTPAEAEVDRAVAEVMADGPIGIKLIGGHRPSTPKATAMAIAAANRAGAYVAFHVGTTETGSHLGGLLEAVELAGDNCLHVAHVNSYLRGMIKDPVEEVLEGLAALEGKRNLVSESYLAVINGTGGTIGADGRPASHVTRNCLQMGGYPADRAGLAAAIGDGYGLVQTEEGGVTVLKTGPAGLELWRGRDTNVSISFPVNQPEATFLCAVRKDGAGRFVVDSISTDGGGIPRNVTVASGLALVRYGALSLAEFVLKASTVGARMLGLKDKGHLAAGADGDITVLDTDRDRAHMTIVGGRIVMANGVVYGATGSGTVITTGRGEAKVKEAGLACQVVEPREMLLYTKWGGQ